MGLDKSESQLEYGSVGDLKHGIGRGEKVRESRIYCASEENVEGRGAEINTAGIPRGI